MSKQTKPIDKQCQSRTQCSNDATWGVFQFRPGDTDVDLNKPIRVFCGGHKPNWVSPNQGFRNIPLMTSTHR